MPRFDCVIEVRNQSKESICVWIEKDDEWPMYDDERRVEFSLEDDRDSTTVGEENALVLPVGKCVCIGISVKSHGLEEGDRLFEDMDEVISIIANVDGECEPSVDDCVDCFEDGYSGRLTKLEIENDGDDDIELEVGYNGRSAHRKTVFGPDPVDAGETFEFNFPTEGRPELYFYVDEDPDPIEIDHADDNFGGSLHVSCSAKVKKGEYLNRKEGSGTSLKIVAGEDKHGNELC